MDRLERELVILVLILGISGILVIGQQSHPPSEVFPQGSGSLLDSDMVDGKHASEFILQTDVSATPQAGRLLKLDESGKFPESVFSITSGTSQITQGNFYPIDEIVVWARGDPTTLDLTSYIPSGLNPSHVYIRAAIAPLYVTPIPTPQISNLHIINEGGAYVKLNNLNTIYVKEGPGIGSAKLTLQGFVSAPSANSGTSGGINIPTGGFIIKLSNTGTNCGSTCKSIGKECAFGIMKNNLIQDLLSCSQLYYSNTFCACGEKGSTESGTSINLSNVCMSDGTNCPASSTTNSSKHPGFPDAIFCDDGTKNTVLYYSGIGNPFSTGVFYGMVGQETGTEIGISFRTDNGAFQGEKSGYRIGGYTACANKNLNQIPHINFGSGVSGDTSNNCQTYGPLTTSNPDLEIDKPNCFNSRCEIIMSSQSWDFFTSYSSKLWGGSVNSYTVVHEKNLLGTAPSTQKTSGTFATTNNELIARSGNCQLIDDWQGNPNKILVRNSYYATNNNADCIVSICPIDGGDSAVGDAPSVNGIQASTAPEAGKLLALDSQGKFPAGVLPTQPSGTCPDGQYVKGISGSSVLCEVLPSGGSSQPACTVSEAGYTNCNTFCSASGKNCVKSEYSAWGGGWVENTCSDYNIARCTCC